MPLTISHPAASAPFSRFGLSKSALIIGSLIPDFPYFIPPFFYQNEFSHSIAGLFVFCLPVGLVSLAAFHFFIKEPMLSLFPSGHQSRLYGMAGDFSFLPLRRFLMLTLSVLFGAFTHVFWDSFTHPEGWMVARFVLLKAHIFELGSSSVQFYTVLQHGSTIAGMALLLYWYFEWYKQARVQVLPAKLILAPSSKIIILAVFGLIALSIAIFGQSMNPYIPHDFRFYRLFVSHVFIVTVSVFSLELMFFSIYWHSR